MKKIIALILVAVVSACCLWLFLRPDKTPPPKDVQTTSQPPATNLEIATPISELPQVVKVSNVLERPFFIDEDKWDRLMMVRQTLLSRNQPVEFYARVVDQNVQPVEGVNLSVKLHRVDEKMFATTNFLSKQLGDEIVTKTNDLVSDAQGWVQLKGVTGFALDIIRLTKDGYVSRYSDGHHRGVTYESGGRRNTSGDVQMTNAWNPTKGYTFHLWKKGETEPVLQWRNGCRIIRETLEHPIALFPSPGNPNDLPDLVLKTPLAHPEIPSGDRSYDRWIILEAAPEAGIQETTMPYPYAAPQDGYGRDFKFLYQRDAPGSEGWTRRFYVKARNGKVFASLAVVFSSSSGLTLQVDAIVNPNGSRNLEPDPEKQITDPEEIRRLDETTRMK